VSLETGLTRDATCEWLITQAESSPELVVGLDFAFSLPAWFLREHDLRAAPQLWDLAAEKGEDWLRECEPPFWGRTGKRRPPGEDARHLRATDVEAGARSVFQVNGGGAVGTGTIRGLPVLKRLRDASFSIWPFDQPGWPRVVEIYPRLLTGPVTKSRATERRSWLDREASIGDDLREQAASSEDAFDAAASALRMSEHADELAVLAREPGRALEGRIWRPARNAPE
jgi:hypothetical protein